MVRYPPPGVSYICVKNPFTRYKNAHPAQRQTDGGGGKKPKIGDPPAVASYSPHAPTHGPDMEKSENDEFIFSEKISGVGDFWPFF